MPVYVTQVEPMSSWPIWFPQCLTRFRASIPASSKSFWQPAQTMHFAHLLVLMIVIWSAVSIFPKYVLNVHPKHQEALQFVHSKILCAISHGHIYETFWVLGSNSCAYKWNGSSWWSQTTEFIKTRKYMNDFCDVSNCLYGSHFSTGRHMLWGDYFLYRFWYGIPKGSEIGPNRLYPG